MGLLNFIEHPIQGVRGLLGGYGQPQDGGDYFDQNGMLIGNGGDASRPASGGMPRYAPQAPQSPQGLPGMPPPRAHPTGLSALLKIPGALTGAILNDLQSGADDSDLTDMQKRLAIQQAYAKQQALQAFAGRYGGAGPQAAPGPPVAGQTPQGGAGGPPMLGGAPGGPMPASRSLPSLRQVAPDLVALQAAGVDTSDLLAILDKSAPNVQVDSGSGEAFDNRDPSTIGHRFARPSNINGFNIDASAPQNLNQYFPKLPDGAQPLFDGHQNLVGVKMMDGSIQSIQAAARAQSAGAEEGKAGFDLVPVDMGDGTTQQMSRADALRYTAQHGGGGGGIPAPGGAVGRSQSPGDKAYQGKTAEAAATHYADIQTKGQQAVKTAQQYQALGRILGDFEGGRLTPAMLAASSTLNSLGIKVNPNLPKAEAASALSNQIVLSLMGGSLGTGISNADRDFVTAQGPTLIQTAQGRNQIIKMAQVAAANQAQQATFARQWVQRFGRIDAADGKGQAFDDQWNRWIEAHPLVAPPKAK